MRYVRARGDARRLRMRGSLAVLAKLRWEFDSARDPDHYFGTVSEVWREGDVLVLVGPKGVVRTRYVLIGASGRVLSRRMSMNPARDAYQLLREL